MSFVAPGKDFRLSAPGIGPPYLAKRETRPSHDVPPLTRIPAAQIVLWVALDTKSFAAAQTRHRDDLRNPRYDRGFYNDHFPEPCINHAMRRSGGGQRFTRSKSTPATR